MPVLHEYRSKRGMYVKARHGNSMVTYQLAPAAAEELRRRGLGEGSQVSPDALHSLVAAGLAYTHGSGAGVVDDPTPTNPAITVSVTLSVSFGEPPKPRKRRRKKQKQQPSGGRLYPPSCYGDARPTPTPPSRPYTPPVLLLPAPPALPAAPMQSGDRLYPASCYAGYEGSPATHHAPAARTTPVPSLPPRRAAAKPAVVPEPFDWWWLAGRLWAGITYEFGGIAVWLWLLMLIGVLVPGLLLASVAGRR